MYVKHKYHKKIIFALQYDKCLILNLKGVLYDSETCFSGSVKLPPNIFDVFSWELGCHCEKWGCSLLFSLGIYSTVFAVCHRLILATFCRCVFTMLTNDAMSASVRLFVLLIEEGIFCLIFSPMCLI